MILSLFLVLLCVKTHLEASHQLRTTTFSTHYRLCMRLRFHNASLKTRLLQEITKLQMLRSAIILLAVGAALVHSKKCVDGKDNVIKIYDTTNGQFFSSHNIDYESIHLQRLFLPSLFYYKYAYMAYTCGNNMALKRKTKADKGCSAILKAKALCCSVWNSTTLFRLVMPFGEAPFCEKIAIFAIFFNSGWGSVL